MPILDLIEVHVLSWVIDILDIYIKKSVILKFRLFSTFNDSIIKEISSAIINMIATRQLAIILA